jgi:hypothetical protein
MYKIRNLNKGLRFLKYVSSHSISNSINHKICIKGMGKFLILCEYSSYK